ncbi:hypothetical protein AALA17_04640 [Lactobacillaceae bacterium 24-114]
MDNNQHFDDEPRLTRQQYRQQNSRETEKKTPDVNEPLQRSAARRNEENSTTEQKIARLKKRLNIAILVLLAAIIVVYLILFLV